MGKLKHKCRPVGGGIQTELGADAHTIGAESQPWSTANEYWMTDLVSRTPRPEKLFGCHQEGILQ
jgi:hypothetical protein